ncbi:hypothetical protein E5676_scaffold1432G00060 [Cucumis melo var. makuwa]|uniref:Uncharacterized protein n=1 Tax=Cucumis melo var. makuwa TaxID=1194695 RepID=A0A5A7UR63_CUCMM|nr:hypothetical protein E6C27_scaffold1312G00010 [Cucumis melo var. makuwa]TYK14870.1 hypothetical protein E5676_scaffold1432G00060 [Cucumis melo var. makuwa]
MLWRKSLAKKYKGMSPLEPRLRSEEPGLVSAQLPKKGKSKARTSRPEDVQRGNKMSAHDLDKLIKIENGLLSFNGPLSYFLYAPFKAMKWEKFFMSSPLRRSSVSPSHAPVNPLINNLDLEHIDLNVPIVNFVEGDVFAEKMVEEVKIIDPKIPLIIYNPLFQDIPIEEDIGMISLEEEAPPDEEVQQEKEAPMEKEVDLRNVLYNFIVKPMNATFTEVL